ncbi:uncharacterized protein PV09_07441 [Verruconis gallopava]|uniref:FAD-binding domain-containing protein n=1 Tax=Verruconis gallopava TaxID=253628 RepID=A0A0D2A3X2_9PEZI|nr:uncharacterized protein PV09_07441 [Verruconis gallopava]KIW01155.1 hypothetical protein PV09_07441 [Verruconis gallopava]
MSCQQSLNILISGCGIAAPVLAYWLLRANPLNTITILDRDPEIRLTGASVDIRSSAVDIIKWMAVEEEIRKHTTNEEGIQWIDATGKPIATMRATGRTDIQSFTSEFEIFRGELAKIFLVTVLDRVNVIYNETVEKYQELEDGVEVTLTMSKNMVRYDVLVAADGFGSKIRGMMLNAPSRDQVFDEGVHIAYFTLKKDLLQGGKYAKWYSTTGGRCVLVRPDPSPEGRTRANLMTVTTKKDVGTKKRLNDALAKGNNAFMDVMSDMYKDVGWLTPEILKGMRESDDFYCSLFGQIRSPHLCTKRVVLLGDAGYATPGIGTSLAIIGAYVLAGELATTPDHIPAALKRYEALMQPFVKSHQGGVGEIAMQLMVPQTRLAISIRNAFLFTFMGLKLDRVVMRAAAWMGFSEKKLAMPDYPWTKNEG